MGIVRKAMAKKNVDVEVYWLKRGKGYLEEFQKRSFFKRLKNMKADEKLVHVLRNISFRSVLDAGCGFGRMIKLILDNFDVENIMGIDLSPQQIEHARKYVKSSKVQLSTGTIYDLDAPDNSYDLVIAVSVLMHIPFNKIEKAIAELVRVSKRHIINLDWYERGKLGEEVRGYCFAHNYPTLYKKAGINKVEIFPLQGYLGIILRKLHLWRYLEDYLFILPVIGWKVGLRGRIFHAIKMP
jgi:SAM-dependent methyltransferase